MRPSHPFPKIATTLYKIRLGWSADFSTKSVMSGQTVPNKKRPLSALVKKGHSLRAANGVTGQVPE
jgi:hypothetical protein